MLDQCRQQCIYLSVQRIGISCHPVQISRHLGGILRQFAFIQSLFDTFQRVIDIAHGSIDVVAEIAQGVSGRRQILTALVQTGCGAVQFLLHRGNLIVDMGDGRLQPRIACLKGVDHGTVFLQIVIQFLQFGTEFLYITVPLYLIRHRIALFKYRGSRHLDKGLIDGILQSSCHRIRDFGGNGIALLILIIDQRRILKIIRKYIVHTISKFIGNDDGCIIFSGFHALFCLFLGIQKDPFYTGVGMQAFQYGFSHIYHRSVFQRIVLIQGYYRHRNSSGIGIGIPVGKYIKPRIQRRYHTQPDNNNQSKRLLHQFFQISGKNLPNIFHIASSNSSSVSI